LGILLLILSLFSHSEYWIFLPIKFLTDSFAVSRSGAKVILFPAFLAFYLIFSRREKSTLQLRTATLLLLILVVLFLFGIVEYFYIARLFELPLWSSCQSFLSDQCLKGLHGKYSVFSDGDYSVNRFHHIHSSKAVLAFLFSPLGELFSAFQFDYGKVFLGLLPKTFLTFHSLLFILFVALSAYVLLGKKRMSFVEEGCFFLSLFILLKGVIDGGLLYVENLLAFFMFSFVLLRSAGLFNRTLWIACYFFASTLITLSTIHLFSSTADYDIFRFQEVLLSFAFIASFVVSFRKSKILIPFLALILFLSIDIFVLKSLEKRAYKQQYRMAFEKVSSGDYYSFLSEPGSVIQPNQFFDVISHRRGEKYDLVYSQAVKDFFVFERFGHEFNAVALQPKVHPWKCPGFARRYTMKLKTLSALRPRNERHTNPAALPGVLEIALKLNALGEGDIAITLYGCTPYKKEVVLASLQFLDLKKSILWELDYSQLD
jgi:hypothetical protein